jgi:hypothetical protein
MVQGIKYLSGKCSNPIIAKKTTKKPHDFYELIGKSMN